MAQTAPQISQVTISSSKPLTWTLISLWFLLFLQTGHFMAELLSHDDAKKTSSGCDLLPLYASGSLVQGGRRRKVFLKQYVGLLFCFAGQAAV
jgi:hypothetical protein